MRTAARLPIMLTLIVISLCIPVELSFFVFGLRLTVTRLLLLLLAPVLAVKMFSRIVSHRYRFVLSDLLVPAAGCWMILGPAMIGDLAESLHHAGPDVLEFGVSYFATRLLLSKHGQALIFAWRLCLAINVVAVVGLLDSVTSHYVVHEFFSSVTGAIPPVYAGWEDAYRMGFLRASGPIEHPILFAFMCVVALLMSAAVPALRRKAIIVFCGAGAIFSFSSGPIQCIVIGLGLLAYGRFVRMPSRWLALVVVALAAVVASFMISNSPISFMVSHLIFSSGSGYYRVWTWTMVIDAVSQSPWYGLGYGALPEDINHSIDSLWLVLAMRSGVPGAVLVALAVIGCASLRTRGAKIDLTPDEQDLGMILGIILVTLLYISFAVDLWGATWILTGLLTGVRAHLGELGHLSRAASPIRPMAPIDMSPIEIGAR